MDFAFAEPNFPNKLGVQHPLLRWIEPKNTNKRKKRCPNQKLTSRRSKDGGEKDTTTFGEDIGAGCSG